KASCEAGAGAQIGLPAVAGDGSVTFTLSTPAAPAEIYRLDNNSHTPRQLTRLNSAFVAQHQLSKPETLWFRTFDGKQVQGWLYPVLNATGRAPLILSIHGGPHGSFGFGFNPQFEFYAGSGYAVLAINPRGSSGYGQRFSDGCIND